MLAVALGGCDYPNLAEYVYAGTQLAVAACIKRNASSLVDETVIKEHCIKKHQKHIDPKMLVGTLTPTMREYALDLEANIKNKSTDQVITGIVITVTIPREGSPNLVLTGVVSGLWIYPDQFGHGHALSTADDNDPYWTKANELMKAGAKWSWTISAATAVGFKLKT
jgi:hypothetical protein